MALSFRVITALVTAWTRLYTAGLPDQPKQRRRLEIASDLWEQSNDRASTHAGAVSIALRCVAGMPSDLVWSISARSGRRSPVSAGASVRRASMYEPRERFLGLSALCGLAWALVFVSMLDPTRHSLAFAGAVVVLVALAGWALELRADQDSATAITSFWPLALAAGVAATGMGLVVPAPWAGLLVAVPLAGLSSAAWVALAREEIGIRRAAFTQAHAAAAPGELAKHAAAGDVIAIERRPARQVPRRDILRAGLWLGIGSYMATFAGVAVDYLWERKPELFGGIVSAGNVAAFPPGSKTRIQAGRFWLVNLTAEQGGPGFLALWQKCPHLGCTVPWEPNFRFVDPATGDATKGWFRCPCHQSTYNDAGVRVHGPAPRSMNRMELSIDPATKAISVDTGRITKGATDNAAHAVRPAGDE
jgi:cytochrome b6-f complex iron-sulfur subunit